METKTPTSTELLKVVAAAADDALAQTPVAIDVSQQLYFTDTFFIVSADNPRHLRAVSEAINQAVKKELGVLPRATEGTGESEWIVLDYGDLIVHVFLEDARGYYQLEKLWADSGRIDLS